MKKAGKQTGKQIIKDSIIIGGNAENSNISLKNKEVSSSNESKSIGYYLWKGVQILIPLGILIFAYLSYFKS